MAQQYSVTTVRDHGYHECGYDTRYVDRDKLLNTLADQLHGGMGSTMVTMTITLVMGDADPTLPKPCTDDRSPC